MNARKIAFLLMALLMLATSCSAPVPGTPTPGATPGGTQPAVEGRVDGYMAVAPRVLRAGQSETVSVALLNGRSPSSGTVRVALYKGNSQLVQTSGYVDGRGELKLDVPKVDEGDYRLLVAGAYFQGESAVRVEDGTLVFLETDKPIYKPGQTIHMRLMTVDPALKPVADAVSVEVLDAKGLKVYKSDAKTDDYGMATLDLPLSPEPNLGVWKITAKNAKRSAQLDVRVEKYVLPKYEVNLELPKDWVLVSDKIKGTVSAEYSYGKPVTGEAVIKASRYVGTWQEFASVTKEIKGDRVDFELPAVQYVSGVPGAKGMGQVQLDVTVREKSTGYEEKTSRLLDIANDNVTLQVIPDSVTFKPGLPLNLLVLAETPDGKPVDAAVVLNVNYTKKDFKNTQERVNVSIKGGKALAKINPPADAIAFNANANSGRAYTQLVMQSGYSPTGSFISLEQTSQGVPKVGDTIKFKVTSTKEAANFYYEVVARGTVVFSDFSRSPEIAFAVTPQMAPSARLLVYQILPTTEVAADYVPFSVTANYPQQVQLTVDKPEAKPGDPVQVNVQTQGAAKVGLAAVDKSVFILAENRLNLQQVFDELERLFQKPQAELHEARPLNSILARGAKEVFQDAGVVVMSNKTVPAGMKYDAPNNGLGLFGAAREAAGGLALPAAAQAPAQDAAVQKASAASMPTPAPGGLAEVQRVRQFFPETWVWDQFNTDASGKAQKQYTAPDSITTWMLRAVALSKQTGLGVAEAQMKVFQKFFVTADLPYAVIRGEQFPVKVAVYNYTDKEQEFVVDLDQSDWFDVVGSPVRQTVRVAANDVAGVSFTVRPTKLGTKQVKATARSTETADAIVKDIIVEPEGVARENVENFILAAGAQREVEMGMPQVIVDGSGRGYFAITGNYLTQSIAGLEKLLQMPFGCGEQNMLLFAPNVFVTRYLKETGQLKPEIMAKAENMMITGYQRELTYRRNDGSFSAFGNQDKDGSLWLTAFVLKTFAQAKDIMYIDQTVLDSAKAWIVKNQKADGSFEPVGFLHHQELLGGLKGKSALTAYVAIALKEAKDDASAAKAVRYLEGELDKMTDPYALAITAYAMELVKSPRANAAHDKLMAMAKESDGALYWGSDVIGPEPLPQEKPMAPGVPAPVAPINPGVMPPRPGQSAAVETTGYATLALAEHGDRINAGRAARWLVSKRNSYGGYASTQDTVVGLQALTRYAADARTDVDATVVLRSGDWNKRVSVNQANADVLQMVEVPLDGVVSVAVEGKGQVVLQAVRRWNEPEAEAKQMSAFQIDVKYGVDQVAVNDRIDITATIKFTPPEPIEAGMTVLDVAVPTGFAAVEDSVAALAKANAKIKRYDIAGRKVIIYIEDMMPDEQLQFTFQAQALYPVKAQAVVSQAYSYYNPELKGESLGGAMIVR